MSNQTKQQVNVIVGGGAAGFFGAIACAENNPNCQIIILEKVRQLLTKVRISGGGRCNVTQNCFDPNVLVTGYPRGGKELRGAFSRFQPKDTVAWFTSHGVALKAEEDGRMFPTTDNSESIVSCLMEQAGLQGITIRTETCVTDCHKNGNTFFLSLSNGQSLECDQLLLACGGTHKLSPVLTSLGHTIVPQVPSLFTFNIPDSVLHSLSGISLKYVRLTLEEAGLQEEGPLLITHFGFSGPSVLRLSAWGARFLHEKNYRTTVKINWLPQFSEEELKRCLETHRKLNTAQLVLNTSIPPLPKKLWQKLLEKASIDPSLRWSYFSKQQKQKLIKILHADIYQIDGKTTHKEEFVTCGGVDLSEVNFKTMESKICPHLYFAGEVLNIDGITGGYNFQNAWTTGWIAGNAMAKLLIHRN